MVHRISKGYVHREMIKILFEHTNQYIKIS